MKKPNKKNIESEIFLDFELYFREDEINNDFEKLLIRSAKKEKKQIEKAIKSNKAKMKRAHLKGDVKTYEKKLRSLSALNNEREIIKETLGEKTRNRNREIELEENDFDVFYADFNYMERREIMDFVFKNVEVKTFQGKKINKIADEIISLIDKLLASINYQQILIVQIDGSNIQDIYLMNLEEFENM